MTRRDRRRGGVGSKGWARDLRDLVRDPLGAGAGLVWVGTLLAVGSAVGVAVGGVAVLLDPLRSPAEAGGRDDAAPRDP